MAKTQYRLTSSEAVYSPGIVAWAINGYCFEDDRVKLRNLMVKTYGLTEKAAHQLLSGEVPHRIEDDAVVFEIEEGG